MAKTDRQRWDSRYRNGKWQDIREPHPFLLECAPFIQPPLTALDAACGLGQNTLWLVDRGCRVLGVDISRVALSRAVERARREDMLADLLFVEADLDHFRLPAHCVDLICNVRFLDRALFASYRRALRPGGLLIIATLNWRWRDSHPDAPAEYLLAPEELLTAFADYNRLIHREGDEITVFAARKPAPE